MLDNGAVIYTTDRNVPGTHVQLEFTLRFENKQYLAIVNAVRNGKSLLRQRLFPHPYPEPIHAWAGGLVEAINKQFGTTFTGLLKHELEHLMDTPAVVTIPTVPLKAETVLERAAQDLFVRKDIWEDDPGKIITQPETITTLTLRRTAAGIACLLHVEREGRECELPTAFNSLDQVYAWIGEYDTAKYVTAKLAMDDSAALGLCKRWMTQFAKPLRDWHH